MSAINRLKYYDKELNAWVPFESSNASTLNGKSDTDFASADDMAAANNNIQSINTGLSAVSSSLATKATQLDIIKKNNERYLIAHRGFMDMCAENTIPAMQLVLSLGAKAIEIDVQQTLDKEWVLIHDATIDRTSNGTGTVDQMTLAQVKTFEYGSKYNVFYTGTMIPTFQEALPYLQKFECVFVELKEDRTQAEIAVLVNMVKDYGLENKVKFICYSTDDLAFIRTLSSVVGLGILGTDISSVSALDYMKAVGGDIVIIHDYASLLATPSRVAQCKSYGFKVGVYTIDYQNQADDMFRIGVDFLLCDRYLEVR